MSRLYGAKIHTSEVALTSGCNEAFCATISTLARAGDSVILPVPWYFNHAMWLSMNGIEARALPASDGLLPDPQACEALIDDTTRAIVLVTPNNPGGVEYPPSLITAFFEVARRNKIALIVDETYRDFHTETGAPHTLFQDPHWSDTLIHLYSFSKAYRLTGHRVGAIACAPDHLSQIEKYLDSVTICVSGPGQMAALWGLENLGEWLAGERLEILRRRQAMIDGFNTLTGWEIMGCGAYFAYVRHPFAETSPQVARRLLAERGVLMLPGTMFRPKTDPNGDSELRIAFANANVTQIADLMQRLKTAT